MSAARNTQWADGTIGPVRDMVRLLTSYVAEDERRAKAIHATWDGTGKVWKFDEASWKRAPEYSRYKETRALLAHIGAP